MTHKGVFPFSFPISHVILVSVSWQYSPFLAPCKFSTAGIRTCCQCLISHWDTGLKTMLLLEAVLLNKILLPCWWCHIGLLALFSLSDSKWKHRVKDKNIFCLALRSLKLQSWVWLVGGFFFYYYYLSNVLKYFCRQIFFFIELAVPQGTKLKMVGLDLRLVWKRFKNYMPDVLKTDV